MNPLGNCLDQPISRSCPEMDRDVISGQKLSTQTQNKDAPANHPLIFLKITIFAQSDPFIDKNEFRETAIRALEFGINASTAFGRDGSYNTRPNARAAALSTDAAIGDKRRTL